MPSGPLPSVAICIPTYNQAGFLERAIESALRQDYQGPSEVWIADDASTDGTAELLNELERRDPAIAVIRQAVNVGIAANVSALLRAPRCELLVRLDSDDELAPGFLSRLVDLMQAYPEAGYGHSGVTEIDAAGHPTSERRLARSTGFQPAEEALRASLSGYRTVANVLIFRNEALRELDYYSGRPEFVEDYDLSVRMADVGYGNVYLDEPLARYRVWEDQGGTRSRRKGLQLEGLHPHLHGGLRTSLAAAGLGLEGGEAPAGPICRPSLRPLLWTPVHAGGARADGLPARAAWRRAAAAPAHRPLPPGIRALARAGDQAAGAGQGRAEGRDQALDDAHSSWKGRDRATRRQRSGPPPWTAAAASSSKGLCGFNLAATAICRRGSRPAAPRARASA